MIPFVSSSHNVVHNTWSELITTKMHNNTAVPFIVTVSNSTAVIRDGFQRLNDESQKTGPFPVSAHNKYINLINHSSMVVDQTLVHYV